MSLLRSLLLLLLSLPLRVVTLLLCGAPCRCRVGACAVLCSVLPFLRPLALGPCMSALLSLR